MTAAAFFAVNANAYQYYGLSVGGVKVTSDCLSGKGWRFDPDTNTLILNGFNITSGGTYHKKINVYGGKLTGICHMGGKQSDASPSALPFRWAR